MKQNFLMPKLGLTMTEGLVAEWSMSPGERFRRDQTVYVIETDKAANEVAAEADGILLEIRHPAGATVPVGEVLGYWDDDTSGGIASASAVTAAPALSQALAPLHAQEPAPSARIIATPLARRIARQQHIDLARVPGSGPRGRIKAADLREAQAAQPGASPPSSTRAGRIAPGNAQAVMARRLTAAKQEVPHFYLALEADAGRLIALRGDLNASGKHKFTMNDFMVAAVGRALMDMPEANRVWDNGSMLQFDSTDVGIAVTTERGLFVPVLRDAARLAFGEMSRQSSALVEKARAGRLSSQDMSGGAVTVSNAGMFNVTYMTPIITPGHAMTLGVGSVRQVFRPDAHGRPALRAEMGLVLACDHRLLDGVSGLRFLNRVVALLERPVSLAVANP